MMQPLEATLALPRLVPRLPGEASLTRLDNGLTVCLLKNRQAPIVTCALWYRAGARDEDPAQGGAAPVLEHMMFKGSRRFGPGEIDRRTQALGGSNNAFTSHDATAYYFNFARDCWTEALAIEADRMVNLTLDHAEVERERQVILEEISMYEDEPWDALELAVQQALYGHHAYGRPILGTRETLLATGRTELAAFHRRFYAPDNAVLVVAGDVTETALGAIERHLGGASPRQTPRPVVPQPAVAPSWRRVVRHEGEVPRLLVAAIAPAATSPAYAPLRLLETILSQGRASRLQRRLVDELQLCLFVSGNLSEGPLSSQLSIALELVPGAHPERVEAELFALLGEIGREPPGAGELERARQVLRADWVFAHERVHQQALAAGYALTHFDLGFLERSLEAALESTADEISHAAESLFRPAAGGVVGWSLPTDGDE